MYVAGIHLLYKLFTKHQALETAFGMVVDIWDIIIAEK